MIIGSEAQKHRPHELLWMLWFDEKSISSVLIWDVIWVKVWNPWYSFFFPAEFHQKKFENSLVMYESIFNFFFNIIQTTTMYIKIKFLLEKDIVLLLSFEMSMLISLLDIAPNYLLVETLHHQVGWHIMYEWEVI